MEYICGQLFHPFQVQRLEPVLKLLSINLFLGVSQNGKIMQIPREQTDEPEQEKKTTGGHVVVI